MSHELGQSFDHVVNDELGFLRVFIVAGSLTGILEEVIYKNHIGTSLNLDTLFLLEVNRVFNFVCTQMLEFLVEFQRRQTV